MALHLPSKISRLIGDYATLCALIGMIPHELEKRMVARHCAAKLDTLVKLLPRLKNEMISHEWIGGSDATDLNAAIRRLRTDYEGSPLEKVRDSMLAHALQVPPASIVSAWLELNETMVTILNDDLQGIDRKLASHHPGYHGFVTHPVDENWPESWCDEDLLGSADAIRFASHPAGIASADVASMVPGGHPVQDATLRMSGLMTSIRQIDRIAFPMDGYPNCRRLMAEIMLVDYCAMWEGLTTGPVRNNYGEDEPGLGAMWSEDGWSGAHLLIDLATHPHPDFNEWREQRNRSAAHVDPDIPIQDIDLDRWPMTFEELTVEAYRVMNAVQAAAMQDIRSRIAMMPLQTIKGTLGLAGKEGTRFDGL